jgi:hypothetical protein
MTLEGKKTPTDAVLEGLTANALRDHLAHAERQAELADYIDSWEHAQRARAHWIWVARQIRAEIDRRGEEWGGVWPQAQ